MFVLLITVISLISLVKAVPEVSNCHQNTNLWISDAQLEIIPHPIILVRNEKFSIKGHFNLKQEIVSGSKIKFAFYIKQSGSDFVEIPCQLVRLIFMYYKSEFKCTVWKYRVSKIKSVKKKALYLGLEAYLTPHW